MDNCVTYLITPSENSDGYSYVKPSKDDKDLHGFNSAGSSCFARQQESNEIYVILVSLCF